MDDFSTALAGDLTESGKARLREWLKANLRRPEDLERWFGELASALRLGICDDGPNQVFLHGSQALSGKRETFELAEVDYLSPAFEGEEAGDEEEKEGFSESSVEVVREIEPHDDLVNISAAIVWYEYGGRFAIAGDDYHRLLRRVKESPIPAAMLSHLRPNQAAPWRRFGKTASYYVGPLLALHAFCERHNGNLTVVWPEILKALELERRHLRHSVTYEEPYFIVNHARSAVAEEVESRFQQVRSQRRREEYYEAKARRMEEDPATNGRPHEALAVPPKVNPESFSWWCLKLGFMLKSPFVQRCDYVEVIDEIADRCLRTMPLAKKQAKNKRVGDRFGTEENESIPRYARTLIRQGRFERAAMFCRAAVVHGIEPKSPGAFERELARAEKKMVVAGGKANG